MLKAFQRSCVNRPSLWAMSLVLYASGAMFAGGDVPEPVLADDSSIVPVAFEGRFPFVVPPAPACETPADEPLVGPETVGLFRPLSDVTLTGFSTAPPTTGDEGVELARPENDACAYLGSGVTACYLTAPMTVAAMPYRTPYPFCHNPLYFEDANLERCGRGCGVLTSARSTGLFAAQLAILPLKAVVLHPRDHVRALPDCPACHRFPHEAACEKHRACRCSH